MEQSRYEKGLKALEEIHGEVGVKAISRLREISPAMEKFTIEFPFGDIYTRDGLDQKTRQIITISALVTLGNAAPQLKAHIKGALNVGCSREEIVEVIMQLSVYAGFPTALNGLYTAQEAFDELDNQIQE